MKLEKPDRMELNLDFFTINPEDKIPEKGKVLISEPFLMDHFFNRTLIYLTEHTEEGAVGFILNKSLELKVQDALNDFPAWEQTVCMGGPVATETMHFLHTLGEAVPGSMEVEEGIYWGGDLSVIAEMIRQGKVKAGELRFFLGYSGWGAGQLDAELKENSWMIGKVNPQVVMTKSSPSVWKDILKQMDNKYRLWADFPPSPDLN